MLTILYFLKKGADVNVVDKNGQTPLFYAARQGHLEVVKYLLKNKANVLIRYDFINFNHAVLLHDVIH